MTAVYRALPLALDADDEGRTWVAPLPDGPITAIEGAAPAILGVLLEAEGPMRAADIAAQLSDMLEDVPDDLEAQLGAFLEELVRMGIVTDAPEAG